MTRKPLLALALLSTLVLGSFSAAQEARAKVLGKVKTLEGETTIEPQARISEE